LRAYFINASLAAFFCLFAYGQLLNFAHYHKLSNLLAFVLEMTVALFFIVRRDADKISISFYSWITTLGGSFCPLLLRPGGMQEDIVIGEIIQVSGLVLALYGIASLNRSFGLLPAYRGIKSIGPYRWVRHPLYAAYTISHIGYLINNFTVWNLVFVVLTLSFQIMRLLNEERLLSGYDEYREYCLKTRWRLIPLVF